MKLRKRAIVKAAATFTALILLANSFTALTVNADSLPIEERLTEEPDTEELFTDTETETVMIQEQDFISDMPESLEEETPQETQFISTDQIAEDLTTEELISEELISEELTTKESISEESASEESTLEELISETQTPAPSCEELPQEPTTEPETETALQQTADTSKKKTALEFHANVEYSNQGYCVMGTFTEFPPDIVQIQPLSSQNNKSYQECDITWDLQMIEALLVAETKRLVCLHSNFEPLKSYLDGSFDRFYFKLRLTDKNGILYETQSVLIDRGAPQPLPEEITASAWFAFNIRVREMRPLRYYGRYQITVKETATQKNISAVLPDTLPIEVNFMKQGNAYATGTIDCPVTWKPLSLPSLTAGESVTIEDAAQEIIVPAGTLVSTPVGVFRLDAPLGIEDHYITDEVRLVLNVVSTDEKPTGALTAEWGGLELAFHLKPTGAASIQTYVISENEKKWKALPKRYGLALLDAVNAQPSTANSGYALVLDNEQEPYRSYLAAQAAGITPTPFFVGLKIKGGVYDGQELILAYPNTYEKPLNLPKLGGSGGNESNAGAANKGDSTPEGQRPSLPQNNDTKKEDQNTNPSPSQAAENITAENMTLENTADLSTQLDLQDQQNIENKQTADKQNATTLTQSPDKGQTTDVIISGENASETATAAIDDTQTEIQTESAAAAETLPAPNKLSAGLGPVNQTPKTNQDANTANYSWFLWIIAAAVIGFGIALYMRRTKGQTDKKS